MKKRNLLISLAAFALVAAGCNNRGTSSSGQSGQSSGASQSTSQSSGSGATSSSAASTSSEARTLSSISAVYNGAAIDYGEALDKNDVVVTAHYSDQTDEPVSDFEMEYNSETADAQMTVTVTFGGKSTTFQVDVNAILLSITAVYNGPNIKYQGSILKSDVAVTAHYSDNTEEPLAQTAYDATFDSKRPAGTYNDGQVTGKGSAEGKSCTFSVTIDRDHLPVGYELVEAEISRMVTVMNPTVTDPEYHVNYVFNANTGVAYAQFSGYQTELSDSVAIVKEAAALLAPASTAASVPYDDAGAGYGEFFLNHDGLEMYVYAYNPSGQWIIQYGAYFSQKMTEWPNEQLAAYFELLASGTTTTLPQLSDYMCLEFSEYYKSYGIYELGATMNEDGIGGYINPTETYKSTLESAGWLSQTGGVKFSNADYSYISPDGKIGVETAFLSESATFAIFFYTNALSVGFPTEVATSYMETLGSTNSAIAAIDSAFFSVNTSYWKTYGIVVFQANYETDPSALYEAEFESEGYMLSSVTSYWFYQKVAFSPDKKAMFEYGYNAAKKIFQLVLCECDATFEWDAAKAALMVTTLAGESSTTVIPEVSANNYYFSTTYLSKGMGVIYCSFSSGVEAEATAYEGVLTTASWTLLDPTEDGDTVVASPAADIKMTLLTDTSLNMLQLQIEAYSAPSAEWPTDAIAALIPAGITEAIPAYDGAEVTSYETFDSWGSVGVMMKTSDVGATEAGYGAVLVAAGFTNDAEEASAQYYDYYYTSPEGQITLGMYNQDGYVTINFLFNVPIDVALMEFLTASHYTTTGVEAFLTAIEGSSTFSYYKDHNGYYDLDVFVMEADDSLYDAFVAFGESFGLAKDGEEGDWDFHDSSYTYEVQVKSKDGKVQMVIWQEYL